MRSLTLFGALGLALAHDRCRTARVPADLSTTREVVGRYAAAWIEPEQDQSDQDAR